jgi:single-strand DNA-binding protein
MSIDVAFYGFLAADAEARTSKAGKQWVRLRVGIGKDEDIQWVSVAVFGKAIEAAAELRKGDRCYIEGAIKLESWRGQDGVERHGLSVAAFKCDRTHQIGRHRPKRERDDSGGVSAAGGTAKRSSAGATAGDSDPDDQIPF